MKIEKLTVEAFSVFGRFADLLNPNGESIGSNPILFYRDSLVYPFGDSALAVSVTVAETRPFVVDVMEYHSMSGECFMNLDRDGIFAVAPANNTGKPDFNKIKFFEAKKGVAVYISPGVWHHAPYTLDGEAIHSLVILPERTYVNDCINYFLKEDEKIAL